MPELENVMNKPLKSVVQPKRVSIHEGHVALVMPALLATELRAMLQMVRRRQLKGKVLGAEQCVSIASDVLLVMLDSPSFDELYIANLPKES